MNSQKSLITLCLYLFIIGNSQAQDRILEDYNLRQTFLEEIENKEYTKAEDRIRKLIGHYSNDGELSFTTGQLYYHLKKWDSAIYYFKKANWVGYNIAESNYNLACCYALENNLEEAYNWLQNAINQQPSFYYAWMDDADLQILKRSTYFLDKLYHYNRQATDRNSKWQADIDFFNDRMQQFHYSIFQHISKKEWNDRIVLLKSKIDSLKDFELIVELMKITALVGDGHTVVVPPLNGVNVFHRAPFLTYFFDDGLYITEAFKSYNRLLGTKILTINNIPINEVMNKVKTVIPHDNQVGEKWLLPLALTIPEILEALNITQNKLEYTIEVEREGKNELHKISCNQQITGDFLESWLYGYYSDKDWIKVEQNETPSYLTRLDEPYWFEYLNENKLVVFHYNQVQTDPEENETQFIQRLTNFINVNEVKALVIDLRSNEGGDNTIYRPILNGIIANKKINQKGKLFVMIGRRTFSAGMCFATDLEKSTNAIFVGEPTGSSPNFVGESGGVFQLPYSGIYVNASNLYWQNSYAFDNRKFISPKVLIPIRFKDYRKGEDLSLETIKLMSK